MNTLLNRPRTVVLLSVFFVLLAVLVSGFFGPKTITIDARGMPLGEVLKSFKRQSGLTIQTNLDRTMPVTLYLRKCPIDPAFDALAASCRAMSTSAYVVAKFRSDIRGVLEAWEQDRFDGEWIEFRGPFMAKSSVNAPEKEWVVRPEENGKLTSYLRQASISTGLAFLVPKSLTAEVGKLSKRGEAEKMISDMARSAGMVASHHMLLVGSPALSGPPPGSGDPGPPPGGPGPFGGPPGGPPGGPMGGPPGGGPPPEPQEALQFLKARLGELPAAEQKKASAKLAEVEALMESMKDKSLEERQAAFAAALPPPGGGPPGSRGDGSDAQQARRQKQMEVMEANMTPSQREEFFNAYADQKQNAQK